MSQFLLSSNTQGKHAQYYPRKVHVLNWVMGEVGRGWGLGFPFNYSSKAQGSCITPKDTSREEQIYERFRITWVEIYDDDWIILSLKTKIFPNLLFATTYYWAYEQTWNMLERKLTSFVIDLIICPTLQSATVCKISFHLITSLVFCTLSHFGLFCLLRTFHAWFD